MWYWYPMCIFLIFSLKAIIFPPPHQTPSPSTPYRHIPLHTYSPAPNGVVKYDTLPLFPRKNYPFPTISRISLGKSPPCLYNIWTYVLFPLGQMSGARPERRRLPPQNRSVPGKNSKGVVKRDSLWHKEGFPIAGDSGNQGLGFYRHEHPSSPGYPAVTQGHWAIFHHSQSPVEVKILL